MARTTAPVTASVLEAIGLRKSFGRGANPVRAVTDVSLRLERGEILAFLGPNGAGKTTTIKMIAGLVQPDAGRIRVLGVDPAADRRALREIGAVLEGSRNLYWRLTAQENLEYFGVLKGLGRSASRSRAQQLLDELGLATRRRSAVQTLSRGMQQKLALAVALVQRPGLLLLDEPTLGLDLEAEQTVQDRVLAAAREGCAVLLSTHQLDVAEKLASRIAILRDGRVLVDRSAPELLQRGMREEWRIRFQGPLGAACFERLTRLGAEVHTGWLSSGCGTDGLDPLLDALRPVPVLHVERVRPGLEEVFRQWIAEPSDG